MTNNTRYSCFNDKFEIIHRYEKDAYAMPPHTHNAIEIYLNLSDIQNALLGPDILTLKSDTLIIIPSYCIHKFMRKEEDPYNRYILTINAVWLNHIMESVSDTTYNYLNNSTKPTIISLSQNQKEALTLYFENCIQCSDKEFFKKMSCFFDALSFIHELTYVENVSLTGADTKEHLSETRKTVISIIDYINKHLFDNIKIQDIADNFFLSPDYISKIFKKYTSTPIGNYITIQRITHAKKLLENGSTVTETQTATGYSSYEHFFRTFKNNTGMTPREYRNTYYQP